MSNEDGTVWIAFNGEIYNHLELRRELEARGHVFKTTCDTEVIVHGFEEWREDVFSRLNGIFALALVDQRYQRLVLARDPVGAKPLYVGTKGSLLWWSSELAAAVEAGLTPQNLSLDALKLYFLFRFIPAPHSIYVAVHKVPPGHYVAVSWRDAASHTLSFRRFGAKVRSSASPNGRGEWRDALLDELERAIRRQLMADVPVGSLLSGGVDSSLIAITMAGALEHCPTTFGIGFKSEGNRSEAVAAQWAAAQLGVKHRSLELTDEEYLADWPWSFRQIAEPLANGGGLLVYLLCRLASSDHKVVLTGQGADEPLGGYRRHVVERLYTLGSVAPRLLPRLARARLGRDTSQRLTRTLSTRGRVDRYVELFSGMSGATVDRLVPGGVTSARELARAVVARWMDEGRGFESDSLNELLRVDLRMSLADDLLLVADHHSMRASVELRVPFLDLQFLELVERMPSRYKVSWLGERKWLYRQGAAERLPPALRRKVCGPIARVGRKQGFTAPMMSWFAGAGGAGITGDWSAAVRELPEVCGSFALELASADADERHARRSASLYALAQWADAYSS